jgi:hypothetical protein
MRILKVPLPAAGPGTIETGGLGRILAVDWQREQLVAWVEARPGNTETLRVYVATTGEDVPAGALHYVATAQMFLGELPYVVHVYAETGR